MPWELGYVDGMNGKVGVLPVTRSQEDTFKGEEYLNLYPYVDQALIRGTTRSVLWINQSAGLYAPLEGWIRGEPIPQR